MAGLPGKQQSVVCSLYGGRVDRAIAHYRVSTRAQGRSGLGIEAQRAAVHGFAEAERITIIAEHIEAESGKGSDALVRRPQLRAAERLDTMEKADAVHRRMLQAAARRPHSRDDLTRLLRDDRV